MRLGVAFVMATVQAKRADLVTLLLIGPARLPAQLSCKSIHQASLSAFVTAGFDLDQYIWASVTLYLDIINLFLKILQLLNGRRD